MNFILALIARFKRGATAWRVLCVMSMGSELFEPLKMDLSIPNKLYNGSQVYFFNNATYATLISTHIHYVWFLFGWWFQIFF